MSSIGFLLSFFKTNRFSFFDSPGDGGRFGRLQVGSDREASVWFSWRLPSDPGSTLDLGLKPFFLMFRKLFEGIVDLSSEDHC